MELGNPRPAATPVQLVPPSLLHQGPALVAAQTVEGVSALRGQRTYRGAGRRPKHHGPGDAAVIAPVNLVPGSEEQDPRRRGIHHERVDDFCADVLRDDRPVRGRVRRPEDAVPQDSTRTRLFVGHVEGAGGTRIQGKGFNRPERRRQAGVGRVPGRSRVRASEHPSVPECGVHGVRRQAVDREALDRGVGKPGTRNEPGRAAVGALEDVRARAASAGPSVDRGGRHGIDRERPTVVVGGQSAIGQKPTGASVGGLEDPDAPIAGVHGARRARVGSQRHDPATVRAGCRPPIGPRPGPRGRQRHHQRETDGKPSHVVPLTPARPGAAVGITCVLRPSPRSPSRSGGSHLGTCNHNVTFFILGDRLPSRRVIPPTTPASRYGERWRYLSACLPHRPELRFRFAAPDFAVTAARNRAICAAWLRACAAVNSSNRSVPNTPRSVCHAWRAQSAAVIPSRI